jgi:hypothetical protein
MVDLNAFLPHANLVSEMEVASTSDHFKMASERHPAVNRMAVLASVLDLAAARKAASV